MLPSQWLSSFPLQLALIGLELASQACTERRRSYLGSLNHRYHHVHHHHHHHDNHHDNDHHYQHHHHQVNEAQTAGPLPKFQFGRRRLLAVQLISSPAPAYTITFSVWGLKTHKQTNKQTYIQQTKPAYLSTCCVFDHLFRKSPLTFSALSLEP